ncbi:MAG TPA: shikimate kinase [Bacteroidales bacterium]|nr:shikimate kinase [Bacteroidales bacterium]HPT20496.1 shikimate kinase [Bacteroidales bacterium]
MPENYLVYIIGFMGSGKSTAGEKLSSLLGWPFIDLDKAIEEHCRMPIPDIFSKYGELYFRTVETEVLKSIKPHTSTVISAGGGTPCHGDNMEYMLKNGLTVYLKMTPEQLKNRLLNSTDVRPLIKDLSNEELLGFIVGKLSSREKWYEQSKIIIEAKDLNIHFLHSIIQKNLNI